MTNHALLTDEEWEAETIARQKRFEKAKRREAEIKPKTILSGHKITSIAFNRELRRELEKTKSSMD